MKRAQDFSDLKFVHPENHSLLCYHGEKDAFGRWVNGVLRTEGGDVSFPVEEGIARFHFGEGFGWDNDELREAEFRKRGVDPNKLIERNYEYMVHQWPEHEKYLDWIRRIAATKGPIVEIAVGPGGGAAPLVLQENPDAYILMTDIGLWPLRQWQRFAEGMSVGSQPPSADKARRNDSGSLFDSTQDDVGGAPNSNLRWRNLRFAQFDATEIPIASGSVAAVVSMGGISNIQSKANSALREAYRILQPGGVLYAVEFLPDHKITEKCPPEMIAILKESYPHLETGFRPVLEEIGFNPVRIKPMGKRPLVPGEGGLADFCKKHKVVMYLKQLRFWAKKG